MAVALMMFQLGYKPSLCRVEALLGLAVHQLMPVISLPEIEGFVLFRNELPQPQDQTIPVDLMATEIRTFHTGELGLPIHFYPAGTAHARAVDHEGCEADDSLYPEVREASEETFIMKGQPWAKILSILFPDCSSCSMKSLAQAVLPQPVTT